MKNLLFLSLILLTASCTKSDLDVEVKGEIFLCCNIWEDFVNTDNSHTEAVSDFLDDNNIAFSDIETINNGFEAVCVSCCLCPAGMEIKFKIDEEDLETVLSLGFEQ